MTKIGKAITILTLLTACTVEQPESENQGDRGQNCSGAQKCLNRKDWLLDFDSLIPTNIAIQINDIVVIDECKNGENGLATIDREEQKVFIPNFFPPNRYNRIKITYKSSNCLLNEQWAKDLTPRQAPYGGKEYIYFKLDYR